jgi:acyl-CoA synthetase (AMP-forming)/AMP-acid ligase II
MVCRKAEPDLYRQASDIGQGLGALIWISEVDQPDKLASIGAVGELLLKGPTLAQGYFKDPTKTTESFIIDPIWTRAEAKPDCDTSRRVYRTGDLVRYGLNGSIEFVGRRDRQVKLRGQRIELAEIELHLRRSMPQGMEAIVEMGTMQGQTGTPQLIAFINVGQIDSGDRSCTLSTERRMLENFHAKLSEIEEYMASKLPVYMVPTLYLPMEGLGRGAPCFSIPSLQTEGKRTSSTKR